MVPHCNHPPAGGGAAVRQGQSACVRRGGDVFRPTQRAGQARNGYERIERLAGEPLHEIMRKMVIEPLQMKDSSMVWRDAYETQAAVRHDSLSATSGGPRRRTQAHAAATLYTTAADSCAGPWRFEGRGAPVAQYKTDISWFHACKAGITISRNSRARRARASTPAGSVGRGIAGAKIFSQQSGIFRPVKATV